MGNEIQIDAFEVQLGAGLLLQFAWDQQVVRVLADAGVHASGYSEDHVHKQLDECFTSFKSNSGRRIDLIIGTHYDKDHLAGLVPIIDDETIEIGEAWMPPVADDTQSHGGGDLPRQRDYLAVKFAENGTAALQEYLQAKAEICERVLSVENQVAEANDSREGERFEARQSRIRNNLLNSNEELLLDEAESYFERHFTRAAAKAGVSCEHADDDIRPPESIKVLAERLRSREPLWRLWNEHDTTPFYHPVFDGPELRLAHLSSLANIRRASAADAINATSLYRVVSALRKRGIPIRCYTIADGQPRRFIWRVADKRFAPSAGLSSNGLELQLLGPSRSLVKKHWDRLPLGNYLAFALLERVPVKNITPSNQLSFVGRFDCAGQKLLVAGDAGCVDFKIGKTRKFHPALVKMMKDLHVVQVAHHAGRNAEFYNVLLESGYPDQEECSFLLLSHATKDRLRPSEIFAEFIEKALRTTDILRLLFTSQPIKSKVEDYEQIIHPIVGAQRDHGNIRLKFDGTQWQVTKHAIAVASTPTTNQPRAAGSIVKENPQREVEEVANENPRASSEGNVETARERFRMWPSGD